MYLYMHVFVSRTPSLREREREAAAETAGTALGTAGPLQQTNNQVNRKRKWNREGRNGKLEMEEGRKRKLE